MPGVFVKPVAEQLSSDVRPITLALIGGTNKAFVLDGKLIARQLRDLAVGDQSAGGQLVVSCSRRTPSKLERELRKLLTPVQAVFIDRHDRTTYVQAVSSAQRFAVTPDSITMVCESLATLRPLTWLDLPCFSKDTSTFRFASELRTMRADDAGQVLRVAAERVLKAAASQYEEWLRK
jgi:mitochondrial fission protein ELM1